MHASQLERQSQAQKLMRTDRVLESKKLIADLEVKDAQPLEANLERRPGTRFAKPCRGGKYMETAPHTWRSCRRITRQEWDSRRDQALVSDGCKTLWWSPEGDPETPKGFGEVDAPSSCRR